MSRMRATQTFHHGGGTVHGGTELDVDDPLVLSHAAFFEPVMDPDWCFVCGGSHQLDEPCQPTQPKPRGVLAAAEGLTPEVKPSLGGTEPPDLPRPRGRPPGSKNKPKDNGGDQA